MISERHIYLYAKRWYKITDIISDLQIIIGEYCALDPKYVNKANIVSVLTDLAIRQILAKSDEDGICREIVDLIWDLHPENRWKVGGDKYESFELGVVRKCLSILRLASRKEIAAASPLSSDDLGEPDSNLLPLKKN